MSVAKVIEVLAEGESIEQAFENALSQSSKTVKSIKALWVDDIEAVVEDNEIKKYRVNAKITFVLDGS